PVVGHELVRYVQPRRWRRVAPGAEGDGGEALARCGAQVHAQVVFAHPAPAVHGEDAVEHRLRAALPPGQAEADGLGQRTAEVVDTELAVAQDLWLRRRMAEALAHRIGKAAAKGGDVAGGQAEAGRHGVAAEARQ